MSIKTNFNVQVEIDPAVNQKPENGEVPTWEDNKFALKKPEEYEHEYVYYEFVLASNTNLNDSDTNIFNLVCKLEDADFIPGKYLINCHTTFDMTDYPPGNINIFANVKLTKFDGSNDTVLAQTDSSVIFYGVPTFGDPSIIFNKSLTAIAEFEENDRLRLYGRKGASVYDIEAGATGKRTIITMLKVD